MPRPVGLTARLGREQRPTQDLDRPDVAGNSAFACLEQRMQVLIIRPALRCVVGADAGPLARVGFSLLDTALRSKS